MSVPLMDISEGWDGPVMDAATTAAEAAPVPQPLPCTTEPAVMGGNERKRSLSEAVLTCSLIRVSRRAKAKKLEPAQAQT